MRIGIDARMYGSAFTGIGKHVARLLSELSAKTSPDYGYVFVVFCDPSNVEKIRELGPMFEPVGVRIPHYSLREQLVYPGILHKAKLDLMHFPHFNAPIGYRGNIIVTIHDLILSFYPGKSIGSWFKEAAYRFTLNSIAQKAKRIIAVSAYTKKDLIELLGVDDEKVSVVYNGVDDLFATKCEPERIIETRNKLGIPGNYVLYMGLHREHKNLGRLVRAFKELVDTGYEGMLVLGGKEDPRTTEAREAVRELGLKNRVLFSGHLDFSDVVPLMQGAELYVMPSLYEGFGLPILEAMSGGVPVVASKTTSLPEVGGTAARYFHPLRIDEMAETMREVLGSKKLQKEMVQAGYEQVAKFSWEKMAEETLAIYREALGNKQ